METIEKASACNVISATAKARISAKELEKAFIQLKKLPMKAREKAGANVALNLVNGFAVLTFSDSQAFQLNNHAKNHIPNDRAIAVELVRCLECDGADEFPGAMVPMNWLANAIKSAKRAEPVEIAFNVNEVTFTAGKNTSRALSREIPGNEPEKLSDEIDELAIHSSVLARGLEKTIYAASKDVTREVMVSVLIDVKDDHLSFVASDGHKLARLDIDRVDYCASGCFRMVIPADYAKYILGMVSRKSAHVKIARKLDNGKPFATFMCGGSYFQCPLIDDRYPNYQAVTPREFAKKAVFNRVELLDALAGLTANMNKQTTARIVFSVEPGACLLASKPYYEEAPAASAIVACAVEGGGLVLGLDGWYLLPILKSIDTADVIIRMNDERTATSVEPAANADRERHTVLLMPVDLSY